MLRYRKINYLHLLQIYQTKEIDWLKIIQRQNNAQKKYASEKWKLKLEDIKHQKCEKQKEFLFKVTQDLYNLRENEANLYWEIEANVSACHNY
ncbi:unnamed protein product [Paramecium sonneborni]|uniref:Uncharacterized protein n=1 Tax=Paramecium sonneborni TaxID=65129 RepID=A0A8S1PT29_9CILI|nr:unnamed protein product [Paramecium sonneborni]